MYSAVTILIVITFGEISAFAFIVKRMFEDNQHLEIGYYGLFSHLITSYTVSRDLTVSMFSNARENRVRSPCPDLSRGFN